MTGSLALTEECANCLTAFTGENAPPLYKDDGFLTSSQLIREKFESASFLLTTSRVSPIVSADFRSRFLNLIDHLREIDNEKQKRIIWAISRGFQEPDTNVWSIGKKLAAEHFSVFRDILVETESKLPGNWLKEQSAFAVSHTGIDLADSKAQEYGFDLTDFRTEKYNDSKFFQSINNCLRQSIWSKMIPHLGQGYDQASRKRIVTDFVLDDGDSEQQKIDYYSHHLDGDKQPVAIRRSFTSEARDWTVTNICHAAQVLRSEGRPQEPKGPVFELFKAGFLILNFEEFANLE